MNQATTPILQVYNQQHSKPLAHVVLNGYHFQGNGPIGKQGSMRSFTIVSGDLWEQWSDQAPVVLHGTDGQQAAVRIAALPVEADGYGLIEFL